MKTLFYGQTEVKYILASEDSLEFDTFLLTLNLRIHKVRSMTPQRFGFSVAGSHPCEWFPLHDSVIISLNSGKPLVISRFEFNRLFPSLSVYDIRTVQPQIEKPTFKWYLGADKSELINPSDELIRSLITKEVWIQRENILTGEISETNNPSRSSSFTL